MVASTVVMTLEGILAGRDDDLELSQAMLEPLGQTLYHAFAATSRLVILTKQDRRLAEHWMRMNGLSRHATLFPLQEDPIRRLRAAGETPNVYIDWSAERAATALRDGVPAMALAKPHYVRAAHATRTLPGLQRPWAAMVNEGMAQRAARDVPLVDDED